LRTDRKKVDDGTPIVEDGAVAPGDDLNVAISDFLARGSDDYPFRGARFISLGVTESESLRDFISKTLNGVIPQTEYPVGGEGRITRLEQ